MAENNFIFLDYNSTTPVDQKVLEFMLPWFTESFANPASTSHFAGRRVAEQIEIFRSTLAELLGCEPSELIFTSGSTEAINMAILGTAKAYQSKGKHIITWKTEHKAVLDTCMALVDDGYEVSLLDVDREGLPDLQQLKNTVRSDTILVAMMLVNNETGVIMPVHEAVQIAHQAGALFLCDATQAAGKMQFTIGETGADMLCLSAHKFFGPKGTGLLYIKRKNPRVTLAPVYRGGGHERGLRPGTLNAPGIAGMCKAYELATETLWETTSRISKLRTLLEQQLTANGFGYVNGSIRNRICNTTNIQFPGIKASKLIAGLPQIALATGSACNSVKPEPSHVLMAMGLQTAEAESSIRFSLGKNHQPDELMRAASEIKNAVTELRSI